MARAEQVLKVIRIFKSVYPGKYYLNWSNPLELMVAAILSAQVRDEVVNAITPALFKRFKRAEDYAADGDILKYIKRITFATNKAKNIREACRILIERYNGKVPNTMEALTNLPGIGRKTANTILINAFGKVIGIPVDVHVLRVSYRLGWTQATDAERVEQDLMSIIPKQHWKQIAYWLKDHGRAVCRAPVPLCSKCPVEMLCPRVGVTKAL